jgi:hypothetical protein
MRQRAAQVLSTRMVRIFFVLLVGATITTVVFYGHYRFRLPLNPYFSSMAGAGAAVLFANVRLKHIFQAILVIACAALVVSAISLIVALYQVIATPGAYDLKIGEADIHYSVDRRIILPGQCVTLRWDIEYTKAVYLDKQGKIGHEAPTICPEKSFQPTLTVLLRDDTTRTLPLYVGVVSPSNFDLIYNLFMYPHEENLLVLSIAVGLLAGFFAEVPRFRNVFQGLALARSNA